jgi:GNAT superfamily N-acetyltransferase
MNDTESASPITISRAGPQAFLALHDEIAAVYRAAFKVPPYRKSDEEMLAFGGSIARHTARAGFRAVIAREILDHGAGSGAVVGFAYGHTGTPGAWWYDIVAAALAPHKRVQWLDDAFEFVELAVAPRAQGRGAGGRLHDALLTGVPGRTAVLSTLRGETTARHLYDRRGWIALLNDLHFPSAQRPYVIMGKVLSDGSSSASSGV